MADIIELIFEVIIEGLVEALTNLKMPKHVRYVVMTVLYLFLVGVVVAMTIALHSIWAKLLMGLIALVLTGIFGVLIKKIS